MKKAASTRVRQLGFALMYACALLSSPSVVPAQPYPARPVRLVVAQSPEQYSAWRGQQATSASRPSDAIAQRGRQSFEQSSCAGCHTVRGSSAQGTLGPDLTHLMGRQTIAAGALANTPAGLHQWIRDPQAVKPGTTMPAVPLAADDLRAVIAWLGTLQ